MDLLARLAAHLGERTASVWVVGGCVRDRLCGREANDIDLILPGAVGLAREFSRSARAAFVLLDDGHGTARVVDHNGTGTSLDFCEPQGDLQTDLLQRDFTINAIACTLDDWLAGEPGWIDPSGGLSDLAQWQLRSFGDGSLLEDPLRVLRGHRLAATFGFGVEARTLALMRAAAPGLVNVAAERVRVELLRLLSSERAATELARCEQVGTLAALLPEGVDDLAARSARTDAALALAAAQPRLAGWLGGEDHVALLRLAALLPAGEAPPAPRQLAQRFALSRVQRGLLIDLRRPVEGPLGLLLLHLGEDAAGCLLAAHGRGALPLTELAARLEILVGELLPRFEQPPWVTGDDLTNVLGYTPGPRFKACLETVRLGQIEGRVADRAAAMALARTLMEVVGHG